MHGKSALLSVGFLLAAFGAGICPAQEAGRQAYVDAITQPSGDRILAFVRPGRIAEVPVVEGQEVAPGELLVRQDDKAEQVQLANLKAQYEDLDEVRVKAAQAQLDQKRVDLKKIMYAAEKGAATVLEVEHAKLDVKIAEMSLELAQHQKVQDELKYKEMVEHVERMKLRSPIAGTVDRILVEEGESVDTLDKVIRIVQTDPLWIDAYVPKSQAKALEAGRKVLVAFDKAGEETAVGGILHVGSVADPASETIRVRIELANPEGRPAGERAYVSFPEKGKETTQAGRTADNPGSGPADKKE